MFSASAKDFKASCTDCIEAIRVAKKKKLNIAANSLYADRIRSKLACLRKSFLKLQRNFPLERYPGIAFQVAAIEPLVNSLIEIYPSPPKQMLALLSEIQFKGDSDLAAELELAENNAGNLICYLPEDIIEDRHYILKKVLWEINRNYENACYNSCAAMIRRLAEALIIEAYEHLRLHGLIVDSNDNYFGFNDLIGKASSQSELRLTRETKRVLIDLKFFGDLSVHNRLTLVRKPDLDRLHNSIRVAIEELTRSI